MIVLSYMCMFMTKVCDTVAYNVILQNGIILMCFLSWRIGQLPVQIVSYKCQKHFSIKKEKLDTCYFLRYGRLKVNTTSSPDTLFFLSFKI